LIKIIKNLFIWFGFLTLSFGLFPVYNSFLQLAHQIVGTSGSVFTLTFTGIALVLVGSLLKGNNEESN
jgi:hypothetical protein